MKKVDKLSHHLEKNSGARLKCVFCEIEDYVLANELAYAIFDKFPVSPGHMLIIPNRHIGSFFDATLEEKLALLDLLDKAKEHVDKLYRPSGYNIGINDNEVAGQTIMHLHIHLIPRYIGDMEDPRGGIRGCIPEKRIY